MDNNSTLEKLYQKIFSKNDERLAIIYGEGEERREITYAKYKWLIEKESEELKKTFAKCNEGDWIALKSKSNQDWFILFWAILNTGFNVVLCDDTMDKKKTEKIIQLSKARAMVSKMNHSTKVELFDNDLNNSKEEKEMAVERRGFGNKIALCSSGTTSDEQKIYIFSGAEIYGQLMSNNKIMEESSIFKAIIGFENKFQAIALTPMYHILGLSLPLLLWYVGATVVFPSIPSISGIVNTIKNENITVGYSVPMIWEGILQYLRGNDVELTKGAVERTLGPQFKLIIAGGGHSKNEVIEGYTKAGLVCAEGYGLTETGIICINNAEKDFDRLNGTVGEISSFYKYQVFRDGNIHSDGKGELLVGGKLLHTERIMPDGTIYPTDFVNAYYNTEDFVEIRDGKLTILGRISDVIINSAGENIYPKELEEIFSEKLNPDLEVAVVGQEGQPIIVFGSRKGDSVFDNNADILSHVKDTNLKLAPYKRVYRVYLIDGGLPKSSNLKVKKKKIIEMINKKTKGIRELFIESSVSYNDSDFSEEALIMREDVKQLLAELLNIDKNEIGNNDLLIENLGLNSLALTEIYSLIDDKYDVIINPDIFLKKEISINSLLKEIELSEAIQEK